MHAAENTKSRSCLQFFEVLTGATPTVNQNFAFGTKTFFDYYPSVDMDSADDLITAFTQSGSTEFPSAYVDGRLAGDPVNTSERQCWLRPELRPIAARIRNPIIRTHTHGATIPALESILPIRLRFGSLPNTLPTA